ncbi:alpha/beta hydrolase [Streptomyces sp. NPDC000927]|uniref:alpha/beta hydrolase n=1 Tax=Streptomyces sp. NPDC000927 TaxID=3154371 RepID=UPI003316BE6A
MTIFRAAARRVSAVGLALTACFTALPTAAAAASDRDDGVARSGAGLGRYYHQRLDWHSCVLGPDDAPGSALENAGARCADVTVPLDYSDPGGRTLTVAISRLRATDSRHRVGPLIINPGGPGSSGLDLPPLIRAAMKETGPRYDIIGMDPRFVGRSTPLDCGWPVGLSLFSSGVGRPGFDRQVVLQKNLADRCRATNASALPHVTTRNTARDMDVVRGALGERKISYLGYSYGTYLGTVYSQMFRGRYDRMVLDGALDPRRYNPRLMKGLERENDRALADWAAWAARRDSVYGLGRTRDEVLTTVERVIDAAARRPLTIGTAPEVFRLDDTQVPFVVFIGIADDTDEARAVLGEQVSVLAEAAKGRPTRPSPQFAAMLRSTLGGGASQTGSAQSAILCGDAAAPHDPESYWRDIERSRAAHPVIGPIANNIGPCAFWDRPREEPTQVRHDASALIVAATGDPRTPYTGSVALRGLLPSSRLVTLQGANRHALYGTYGNACVDDEVNRYLATGRLPAADRTCVKQSG